MKLSVIALLLVQGSFVASQFMDIKKICVDRGVCNNNHALNTSLCNACLREFEIYNDMYNKAKNLKPGDSGWAPTSVSKYAVDTPTSAASPALQGNPQALTTAAAPTPPVAPALPAASIPLAVPAVNPTSVVTAPATPAPINPAPAPQLPVLPATVPVAAPLQTGLAGPKLGGQPASGAATPTKDSGASPSQTDPIVPTFLPTSASASEANSTASASSESASASSDSRISTQLSSVLSITTTLVLVGIGIGL